jgi:cobalt-precorrin-5B (C1)-methyltransferase
MEKLKCGFTTGVAAQAASKASAIMLTTKSIIKKVEVEIPCGKRLILDLIEQKIESDYASCGVVKDAGDDPDITNKAKIYAQVKKIQKQGVFIKGGKGVGVVTKPGLPVKVGQPAINPVPYKMILKEVSNFLSEKEGLEVVIRVAGGEELAKRTFNPRLGIVGGISILGTTGIVEPKSVDAYKVSLSLQLDIAKAYNLKRVALVFGYLGERFCKEELRLSDEEIVKIGDYVGFMLKQCAEKEILEVLLIGHIGKLSKVAAGIFNTHHKYGDARLETISAYASLFGAKKEVIKELLSLPTAEASIEILKRHNLLIAFNHLAKKVVERAVDFTKKQLKISCLILSLNGEVIGKYPHE